MNPDELQQFVREMNESLRSISDVVRRQNDLFEVLIAVSPRSKLATVFGKSRKTVQRAMKKLEIERLLRTR